MEVDMHIDVAASPLRSPCIGAVEICLPYVFPAEDLLCCLPYSVYALS